MIRIPKNIIITAQYTSGNEFVTTNTTTPYVGYYYTFNGKSYTGKEPSDDSLELEKIKDKLLKQALKTAKNAIKKYFFVPSAFDVQKGETTRYFVKRANDIQPSITEINLETYNLVKNDPIYFTLELDLSLIYDNTARIINAEKKFSGITSFLKQDQPVIDVTE